MRKFSAEKVVVLVLLMLLIGSGSVVLGKFTQSLDFASHSIQWLKNASEMGKSIISSLSTRSQPAATFEKSPSASPTINASPTTKALPSPLPTKKPTIAPRPTITKPSSPACTRFTVTHLDGSTSRLCYSNEVITKLSEFEYERSSAQAFYEFDMRSASRYQEEYDRSGSSIYLDAKARSEQSAQENLDKRNAAVAGMQEIEKQGW